MSESMAILCEIDFIDNIEVETLFSNVSIASDWKDMIEYQRFLWNDVLHHRFRRTLGFPRRGALRRKLEESASHHFEESIYYAQVRGKNMKS